VYVPSMQLPQFVATLQRLPPSARLTLVTGQEDVGVPREAWRLSPSYLAHGSLRDLPAARKVADVGHIATALERVLLDPRIVHWFAQNYDLTGHSPALGRSPITCDSPLAAKVSPLPLGLDFHTRGEKAKDGAVSACTQERQLRAIRAKLPPFRSRPLRLLAPFSCPALALHPDRIAACRSLGAGPSNRSGGVLMRLPRVNRHNFWHAIGDAAFVAAPQGQGLDTHRLWEVLLMGSVPVVVSSPLDRLYRPLPVLILPSWQAAAGLTEAKLAAWREEHIFRRFGAAPFSNPSVRAMLTTDWWVALIRDAHHRALGEHHLVLHHNPPAALPFACGPAASHHQDIPTSTHRSTVGSGRALWPAPSMCDKMPSSRGQQSRAQQRLTPPRRIVGGAHRSTPPRKIVGGGPRSTLIKQG